MINVDRRYPRTAIISSKNFNGRRFQELKIAISSAIIFPSSWTAYKNVIIIFTPVEIKTQNGLKPRAEKVRVIYHTAG